MLGTLGKRQRPPTADMGVPVPVPGGSPRPDGCRHPPGCRGPLWSRSWRQGVAVGLSPQGVFALQARGRALCNESVLRGLAWVLAVYHFLDRPREVRDWFLGFRGGAR